ncbi:TolC family protein [Tunicatimonas pelagia]|uniref:TolC family protein n=1 Tax=Tunicatimonas pelagia TaxID=931531 RepID=UPI0026652D03|nr:TolC family protein [Tunicatimonas pelagia]WKN42598.1 TolC family protein [Tunicatimonas pelagia]
MNIYKITLALVSTKMKIVGTLPLWERRPPWNGVGGFERAKVLNSKVANIILFMFCCLLTTVTTTGFSQEVAVSSDSSQLTLEEAISQALENNYDIRLERYQIERSQNSVSRALSGQMPTLNLNGSYEWGYANTEIQTLPMGGGEAPAENPPMELEGTANAFSVQPQLNVPIFQGFKGKYRYEQLENAQRMSELQRDGVVEQTLVSTVSAYLEAARLQAQLEINQENIALSYDRWQRVEEDAKFGVANSIRRLQAEVDLKTDSANYRNMLLSYQNSLRNLNVVMVRPLDDQYSVEEELLLSEQLDYEALLSDMKANNTQLKLSQRGIDNALYEEKIAQGDYLPTVQGYANYSYLNSEDEANFLQSNVAYGPNVGVTLSYSIFSGGARKIQQQNAQLSRQEQEMTLESRRFTLEKELRNAYAQYVNNQNQLRIEQLNLATFEQNYQKTQEDFKLGLITASDVRTAQLNLTAAKNRINTLTYAVKQSEIRLLQLSGRLTQ